MNYGNVIIGQSGGPTAVINASLAGAYKTAHELSSGKIYGMLNGIKGLIAERYVDLSEQLKSELDIELLKRTPSSFLGSCRFKLPDVKEDPELYDKIFVILMKLEIKHFLYIGGNDSMDAIKKLFAYSKEKNYDINFIGIPKTIDNDLAITDHTPGFGSSAKFIGTVFKEIISDALVYGADRILIVEIMGRNTGWLAAAAALSKGDDCQGPDMIYLPEVPFNLEDFYYRIDKLRRTGKSIVIAVSEGIKLDDGRYICELNDTLKIADSFGHTSLGGTAAVLSDLVARKFNCKTRPIELSTLMRSSSHISSSTDVSEAFLAGGQAVVSSYEGESGKMVTFIRKSTIPYVIHTDVVDVDKIANIEKTVPLDWITEDGTYVSNELIEYIRPIIQGELTQIMVDGLPRHLTIKL